MNLRLYKAVKLRIFIFYLLFLCWVCLNVKLRDWSLMILVWWGETCYIYFQCRLNKLRQLRYDVLRHGLRDGIRRKNLRWLLVKLRQLYPNHRCRLCRWGGLSDLRLSKCRQIDCYIGSRLCGCETCGSMTWRYGKLRDFYFNLRSWICSLCHLEWWCSQLRWICFAILQWYGLTRTWVLGFVVFNRLGH